MCEPAPGYWLSKDLGDEALEAVERATLVDPLVRTLRELRSDLEASQRLQQAILKQMEPPGFDWVAFGVGTGTGVVLGVLAVVIGALTL